MRDGRGGRGVRMWRRGGRIEGFRRKVGREKESAKLISGTQASKQASKQASTLQYCTNYLATYLGR